MAARPAFLVGDEVHKVKGYLFPGIVVASYISRHLQKQMYVVECTSPDCIGIQYIFSEADLELQKARNYG